jgi:hypothetical protein
MVSLIGLIAFSERSFGQRITTTNDNIIFEIIYTDYNLGVGTDNPNAKLDVSGNNYC